ncbi:hypothetical protein AOR13_2671 [Alteromonas stellipolaris LMG 21856]|nr:hypothetical protein AOR13_2671 [Alteromonas stellipolaris LMG 21856]
MPKRLITKRLIIELSANRIHQMKHKKRSGIDIRYRARSV